LNWKCTSRIYNTFFIYLRRYIYNSLIRSLHVTVTEFDFVLMSCLCASKQRVATYVEVNLKYWVLNKLMISTFVKKWSFLSFFNTHTSILYTRQVNILFIVFLSAAKQWPARKWDVLFYVQFGRVELNINDARKEVIITIQVLFLKKSPLNEVQECSFTFIFVQLN